MNIDIKVARKLLSVVDQGLVHGLGTPEPGKMCVEAAVCYALGLPHGDDPKCVTNFLRRLKIRLNDAHWSSDQARSKGLRRLALIQLGSADALDEKEFAKRCATLAIQTCIPAAFRAAAGVLKSPAKEQMLKYADLCEREPTRENALAAKNEANTAYADADAAASADAYAYAYAYAAAAAAAAAAADADAAASAYAYAYAAAAAAAAADAAAYAAAAADAYAAAYARDKSLAAFAEGVVQILIDMKVPGVQWLHLTEEAA